MSTVSRLAGLATVLLMLVFCAPASAAIFVVEDGGDGHDTDPGDEVCRVNNPPDPPICTLRAAIEEANALGGPDVVDLAVSDVGLFLALGGAIEISSEVTVLGDEDGTTGVRQEVPLSPGGGDRVFDIQAGADVTLSHLTVHQGEANPSNGFFGGNIRSAGTLFVEDSTITAGSGYSAGGIANTGGTLTVFRSTVSGNTALNGGGDAGAILNFGTESPATLQVTNSTISGNQARLAGGVFSYNNAENLVSISSSTIAFNESGDRGAGGGLAISSGTASVSNSIIAKNTSVSPDNQNCSADPGSSISSDGNNLEDGTDCGFTNTGDDQDTDPLLGDLDPNGGPTQTHALLEGSPAIDTGAVECPADDQRGVSRPQGPRCDKGAFELEAGQDTTPPETTIDAGPSGLTTDSTPTFSFSSNEAGSTFECSVDGGSFSPCSSPLTTASLGDGAHTFAVRATDAAENVDLTPAQRAFTVDTAPPNTAIDSGPSEPSTDKSPTFVFSGEAGSRFECSIDGGAFASCTSPFTTGDLPVGKHTLAVRAIDSAGNPDPTPSVFEFEIQAGTVEELPAPKQGVTINVQQVSGTVLIGIPGSAARAARSGRASQKGITFVPLTAAEQIPVGSFLDTRRGTVRLQSAANAAGGRQTGDFLSSIFQVRQSKRRSARGLTDLVLKGGSFNRCGAARGKRASASLSRRAIRRLRANARGRFRTSGRNSSATVRGTRWETIDRCDGTLTKVQRGAVVVRDFRKKKNVVLKAGKSYLARAKR